MNKRYIMNTRQRAKLARIDAALDEARAAGDAEAFAKAFDNDEYITLLAYSERETFEGPELEKLDHLEKLRFIVSLLGARLRVAHRHIDYANLTRGKRDAEERRHEMERHARAEDGVICESLVRELLHAPLPEACEGDS